MAEAKPRLSAAQRLSALQAQNSSPVVSATTARNQAAAPQQNPATLRDQVSKPEAVQSKIPAPESREHAPQTQATPKQEPVEKQTPRRDLGDAWANLVFALKLGGVPKSLLRNCRLQSENVFTAEGGLSGGQEHVRLQLALSPSLHMLYKEAHATTIAESLSAHLACKVDVKIDVTDSEGLTPDQCMERYKAQRQAEAEERMQSDPWVQTMIETFDATLSQVSYCEE